MRIVACQGIPDFLHTRPGLGFGDTGLAVEQVEKSRNPIVHDAMRMYRARGSRDGIAQLADMLARGRIEWHRDVGIGDPMLGEQLSFARQRFGMILQRKVDDMLHADFCQPGRIA